jgi:hypothetical protein
MDPAAAKQQIAERVRQASRFLVTVNANPTVDQLAACIGLTLLINRMNKHATAVFSGKVPSTIEFLQPDKTLEKNTDSLRDFIISLDKNKADKLRYKVENDVVRIYVTPYHTSLSENDFIFAEGDFNVEVVFALGVAQRASLDGAITAHGRILHDATVISLNAGPGKASDLGQVNWQDAQASGLCEMLVSISEAFGPGLIDAQIATAFLTGIVSETQRFSNKKTTPKVMTMSAQLMAAGANQQLIASKLEPPPLAPPAMALGPKSPRPAPPTLKPEGVMDVPRDEKSKGKVDIDLGTTEIHIDEQGNIRTKDSIGSPEPAVLPKPETPTLPPPAPAVEPSPPIEPPAAAPMPAPPPAEPPENPGKAHAFMGSTSQPPGTDAPFSDSGQPPWAAPYETLPVDPLAEEGDAEPGQDTETQNLSSSSSNGRVIQPPSQDVTVTPVDSPVDSARNAVESALSKVLPDQALSSPEPALPTKAPNDTPELTLPIDGSGSAPSAPPPLMPQDSESPAPPPIPPPLMAAPGAVIPIPPQQK